MNGSEPHTRTSASHTSGTSWAITPGVSGSTGISGEPAGPPGSGCPHRATARDPVTESSRDRPDVRVTPTWVAGPSPSSGRASPSPSRSGPARRSSSHVAGDRRSCSASQSVRARMPGRAEPRAHDRTRGSRSGGACRVGLSPGRTIGPVGAGPGSAVDSRVPEPPTATRRHGLLSPSTVPGATPGPPPSSVA